MKSVLFDLDGTLIDTSEGIIKGIEEAERVMGLPPIPYDIKKSFIGPPLVDSFVQYYSLTESKAKEAVKEFRKYYSERGKYEAIPYNGIPETLKLLNDNNIHVFVATSKPTIFATDIVSHFDLKKCFVDIVGSNLDNSRSKKEEVIQFILDHYTCTLLNTVMIGDKYQDIEGAKKTGIRSIGVTYGFGSQKEIIASSPDYIATTVNELFPCVRELIWR